MSEVQICAASSATSARVRCCRSWSKDCAGSSTAATTRPASRWWTLGASTCAAALASSRVSKRCWPSIRLPAATGLGHTRWATHGRPTEENAHPHRDCTGRLVVVHNGIIENYLELKSALEADGHRFVTETDTEIVAHLVEREMRGDGLEAAVGRALRHLRGLFAIVLISADDPDVIVAARNGPPVVVGLGDGEFFVASDIPAILSHTRDVVFLDDGEIAVLTRQGVRFTDLDGRQRVRAPQRVLWDPVMAERAGYKHFMLKEIFEQPRADRRDAGRPALVVTVGGDARRDWPGRRARSRAWSGC